MKFNFSINKSLSILLLVSILATLALSSCHKARYKRMVKKRRAGTTNMKKHKSAYQKKLKKNTLSVESPYFIKRKKNYRRRPWYN